MHIIEGPDPAQPQGSPVDSGMLSALPDWAQAAVIGAGRVGDKLSAGFDQASTAASGMLKNAVGMNDTPELNRLSALDAQQSFRDSSYAPLQKQHPLMTAIGEALPSLAVPMGQATMAGRIIAPAAAMGAMGAMQYGNPAERLLRGGVDFAGGLGGGLVGEGVSRLIQPVRNVAGGSAQSAASSAASKINAPLLPSQITGSADLARVEDALANYPGSAGVMRGFLDRQQGAVNAAAQRAVLQPGEALTTAAQDAAKSALGAQYGSMRAAIPEGLPASQAAFDAVDGAIAKLSQGSTSGKQGALGMLNELKDKLYNSKALTPEEYSAWVSDLGAAARESHNPTVSAALKGVGAKMDELARGPLNPQWQKIDQAYAALKTLQKPNVVNPITGDVSALKVAGQLERNATGARATPLADIATYARAVPNIRAGSPTASREAVGLSGALNALWRYPLAKMLTSDMGRDYLARGLLGSYVSPEMSGLLASGAGRMALPLGMLPTAGLLGNQALLSQ